MERIMTTGESAIQALIDKEEIRDLMRLYSRALDRCDAALMKSLFHPDASFEHADHFSGSAEEFADFAVDFLSTLGPLAHYLCNSYIRVDGDRAYGEHYGIAFQRAETNGQSFESIVGARMLDVYERREGIWKILRRRTVVDWNLDIDTNETFGRGVFGPTTMDAEFRGRHDRDDPSYAWLAQSGHD
jgi:hypothetical protein